MLTITSHKNTVGRFHYFDKHKNSILPKIVVPPIHEKFDIPWSQGRDDVCSGFKIKAPQHCY